jgi:hypothetical protein
MTVRDSFVLVRDSHKRNGAVLRIPADSWRELMRRIRKGEPDRG